MTSLTLPLKFDLKNVHLTDEQFYQLCINNPDLILERDSQGALILMSPVGGDSGSRELKFGGELYLWNKQTQLGEVFSSSTVFNLPGGVVALPMRPGLSYRAGRRLLLSNARSFRLLPLTLCWSCAHAPTACRPYKKKCRNT